MYFYPDSNDVITAKMIIEIELFSGYWIYSESRLLNIIEKNIYLKLVIGCLI